MEAVDPRHCAPCESRISGFDSRHCYPLLVDFPDPALIIDKNRRVVFFNRAMEMRLGSKDEFREPTYCTDILRPDLEENEQCLWSFCLEALNRTHIPLRLKNGSGRWTPVLASAGFAYDKNGEPSECLLILRDRVKESLSDDVKTNKLISLCGILDNFPTPFFAVDSNLIITHMNEELEQLTGFTRDEVLGKLSCASVLPTSQCGTDECLLKKVMGSRRPISGVLRRIRDRKGREFPVTVHATFLTNPDDEIIGAFGFLKDIGAYIEAESKIELLTEMTQEGILMVDEDYEIVFANSRMSEMIGRSKEELLGSDVRELLPPQHVEMMTELMKRPDQEQRVRFCSIIDPENGPRTSFDAFETCMAVIRIGKNIMACLYFRDLSKYIEIERELRKANSFLNNLIRSSMSGIVVLDTDGNCVIFNEGAERILGYKAEEVVGHSEVLRKIYSRELAREVMRRMRSSEYGPEGKLSTTRITLTRKDGQPIPVSFSAAIMKERDKEIGSVGIFLDLTEQVKIRRELEEARMQLIQAEKIASLGRMAAGIAHEINNPLGGILIFADLLLRDIGDKDPQWKQDLEEIINQTLRCKQIVTRLLEFSRQPLSQRIPFDPNYIIERCLDLFAHQTLFHNIEIVRDLAPGLPEIIGDPGQIQQVFTNLIINAGTAMDGRGRLTISSRLDAEANMVVLRVIDTGPGIPAAIKDKIFEPFFTTKRPGEGTGLGLSVAYGIIQQHGGRIEVADAPGGGAEFVLFLPLTPPEVCVEAVEDWQ